MLYLRTMIGMEESQSAEKLEKGHRQKGFIFINRVRHKHDLRSSVDVVQFVEL